MAKAHVYLLPGANVEATDTFASWVDTTNQLVYDMGTVVLTTTLEPQPNTSVGGYTAGNAHVQGILSANTLVASNGLRGGSVSAPGNLIISSNTIFNESTLVQVGSNTNNFTVNANNSLFTGNVAIASSKTFTVNASNTQFQTGTVYVKTNAEFTGNRVDIDASILDITSNTTVTNDTTYLNVNTLSIGTNNLDSLVVNAASDFNSSVNIDGTLNVTANSTFNGGQTYIQSSNTIIGNSTTDRLNVTAYLESDLIPASNSVDLGTDALPYGNVHTTYVWSDSDIESLGEFVLKGTATKTIRTTGSNGTYQNLNLSFSNNSVSNTSVVANTSGLFGGYTQLYSLGSAAVNWKELHVQNSFVTGDEVITGDLAVNGGDITTTSAAFNLATTGATTVNAFKAATTVDIGATSGTITINNPTVVGTQTTQNLWNTTALTVNAFGAATAVTLGGTTGTMTLRNPTIVGASATQALFNTTATTVNAFGAATAVNVGATTGTATINNPTVVGSQATVNLWNTTSTTVNAFGAATALNLGGAAGGQTVTIGGSSTGSSTYNIGTGATANTTTKTVNVGTGGAAGSTTNVNIGSSAGGATTINSATVDGAASSVNLWNTGATTVNAFGAATTLNIGGSASTVNVGKTTGNTSVVIRGNTTAGTAAVTSNVTTGRFLVAPSVTTGNVEIGSASNGRLLVPFTTGSSSTSTGAVVVSGGVGVGQNLSVANNVSIAGNLTVDGEVVFTNSNNVTLSISTGNINNLTVYDTLTFDTATISSTLTPTANTSYDLGTSALSWNALYAKEVSIANTVSAAAAVFTSTTSGSINSNTLRVSTGAADAIEVVSSAFGSSNRKVTIKTTDSPLSANVSLTLAPGNTVLQTGTMAITGAGLNQFASTTSAQLAGVISDKTGSGALVFGTAPTITNASLVTPTVGGAGATYSGSTSGSTVLKAAAAAGTTTITMPATTGTMALTSDIQNGSVTVTGSTGLSGTGTFSMNQGSNTTITLTNTDRGSSQNIFKNVAVGADIIVADTNDDTLTIVAAGIASVSANTTTDTLTITATEIDTLASVTGRGATTSTAVTLTNATDSTATNIGALVVTGGVGIGKGLQVGGDARVFGTMTTENVVISGNLTVNGTTTTINSIDLAVDDKNIIIGAVTTPTNTTADGGGITLKGTTDKNILWDTTNSNWTSSEHWNLVSGKTFKINNVNVLTSTSLGSGVVSSSLTSVGTLTTGTWNATAISPAYGGTGMTSYAVGDIIYASGTTTLDNLPAVATGNALISGGVGVAPTWSKIGLTTHVSGVLSSTNGGTGVNNDGRTLTINNGNLTIAGQALGTTLTLGGNITTANSVTTAGNFALTLTTTGATNVTLPTSGTLAVTDSGLNQFAATTSAQLASVISDETGTGALVFDTSPSITTPTISNPSITGTTGTISANTASITSLTLGGTLVAASASELNILNGVVATTAELNKLKGVTVSNTNINTLSGITGNIQDQLDGKQATITGAATTITSSNLTASRVLVSNASGKVAVSAITSTNLDALSEISSAKTIESRLGTLETGKAPVSNPVFTGEIEAPRIYLTSISNANTTNSVSAIQVGPSWGINLLIDTDEVMVRNNGVASGLHINGDGGDVIIGGNTSTTLNISLRAATVYAAGNIVAVGNVTAYSDSRLKENVRTIEGALDKVSQMRGVYFDKDGKAGTGVIAQEIEKVLPEVVLTGEEYKSVAYGNIVGVLIEAIKELKEEIEELKRGK